jgi:hypothetical protein
VLVDHERLLLDFKEYVIKKSQHGQRDLLTEIARLEVLHQLNEGLPEMALRLYGSQFSEDLLRPIPDQDRVPDRDGNNVHALRGVSLHEEQQNVRNGTPRSAS